MPPQQKQDEIDLSTLPPWKTVNVVLKYQGKKERGLKLFEALKKKPKSFQTNISREDIINHAQQKEIYVDPNSLDEKKKKDPQFLEGKNLELTPAVLVLAFNSYIKELNIQMAQAKQDKLEGKEEVKDPKKDTKKDVKKDVKQGGKPQPVVEQVKEEPKEPEKQYKKQFDGLYLIYDYPMTQAEIEELSKGQAQVTLVLNIKQKVNWPQEHDLSMLEKQEKSFEQGLRQRLEDAVEVEADEGDDAGGNNEEQQKKLKRDEPSQEDFALNKTTQQFIDGFINARKSCDPKGPLRRCVIKDIAYQIEPEGEQESLKQFVDFMLEEICAFSFDIDAYNEWAANKKAVPLLKPEQLPEVPIQVQPVEPVVEEKQDLKQDVKKDDKKGAQKDTKIQPQKPVEEKKEEPKVEKIEPKKPVKEPFFEYFQQFNPLELEKTDSGILLEVLLDELVSEQEEKEKEFVKNIKEQSEQVDHLFGNLEYFINERSEDKLKSKLYEFRNYQGDTQSTPYKGIIDECDEREKQAHLEQLFNLDLVTDRERQIFSQILFPGIDRHLMPEVPEKSEALRKAERSQLYPFITCSVLQFERRITLVRFEDIFRENEPERTWNFGDRIYLERHNQNTMRNTLFRCLLMEPSVFLKYNDKDDSLYIAMFFQNPPGRVLRKKWSADWKVLPNLENWINFFQNNENNLKNDFYYDLDYEAIGNLHERIKYIFPTDNSVIVAQKFLTGSSYKYRYQVLQEGVTFGIRNSGQFQSSDFWAYFDNGTILLVDQLVNKREKAIQQQPQEGKKVQQQKGEKVQVNLEGEKFEVAFTLTMTNGLIVRFLPNGDISQRVQRPSKKYLKRNFEDIVDPSDIEGSPDSETSRLVTGMGSVIKYKKDGTIIILYPNGNTSVCTKRSGVWVTTNNKGLKRARNIKDGKEWELDGIPCAKRTDPEQGSQIIIRSDQTLIITYRDGSIYTKHSDGTQMLSFYDPDKLKENQKVKIILIEHEQFATIKVRFDEQLARFDQTIGMGGAYASQGFDDIINRSNTGVIMETYLPDGTRVQGYLERQELPGYNSFKQIQIYLIYMQDGTVVKVNNEGNVVFISAVDRVALNEKGENRDENDIDYFLQLYGVPDERKAGVFSADIKEGLLSTKDDEGNFFELRGDGQVITKIAVSLNVQNEDQSKGLQDRPGTPDIPDGDFIEEENKFLPQPPTWVEPRLFVVGNDNTGFQYLNQTQIKNYFRLKKEDQNCIQIYDENIPQYEKCTSISFITEMINLKQKQSRFIKVELPRNLDIIPQTEKKIQEPKKRVFAFRNLLQFVHFDQEEREIFQHDMEVYEGWQKEQLKLGNEYGVMQKSEEERDRQFNIQLKIMESRKSNYTELDAETIQKPVRSSFISQPDVIQYNQAVMLQDLAAGKCASQAPLQEQKEVQVKQRQNVEKHFKSVHQVISELPGIEIKGNQDQFAAHYFETIEGEKALNEMPQDIFNPVVAHQIKRINAEEVLRSSVTDMIPKNSSQSDINQAVSQQPNFSGTNLGQFAPGYQQDINDHRQKTIIIKPSVFTRADIEEEKRQIAEEGEAFQYRHAKTKEYNVYGNERKREETKIVPCLLKSNPKSELNQQYILTDSLTQNRMKISSMAPRLYLKAPSISENRNEGTHSALAKTIDKRNNLDEMENQKNLMITATLNDNLQKDLLILPVAARFASIRAGRVYEMKITVKNEDVLAQRIVLKNPSTQYVRVYMNQLGPISLGLNREVLVRIVASEEITGQFVDEFQIVSKHEIYQIPIIANILDNDTFRDLDQESRKTQGVGLLKSYVTEIVQETKKKQVVINELNESNNSEYFPQIKIDQQYEIDPYAGNQSIQKENDDSFEDHFGM